ncbi:unnamed protein product [Sphagnum balticum]
MTTFSPTNLGITFPSNFFVSASALTIAIATTAQNNFFQQLTYNNIQILINNASSVGGVSVVSFPVFTSAGTTVYMTGLNNQLNSGQWTYVLIRGIQNPSAYVYANFTLAYYLISNSYQVLQWVYQYPLTYYISPPPQYISINSVNVSDYDLLYPSVYTFNFTGTNGSNIAIAGKNLSYIVVIPDFYKSTLWANRSYVIYFNKSESSVKSYFRNILPVTITVYAASNATVAVTAPTISIPTFSDSTIGYPVNIPIQFSLPSSTEMMLFLTIAQESNQTLAQYSPYLSNFSITPLIINILPQQSVYSFTLIQGKQVVPPPITLNLKLTSNYPIVHVLTTPVMYVCFDRDPKYNVLYPPLRVTITPFLSSCNLQDVGKVVTNIMISNGSGSSASEVVPKIISISVISVASTGASININTISTGTIYYLCLPAGSPAITNGSSLVNMTSTTGITGSSTIASQSIVQGQVAQINYYAVVNLSNL